jgi:hypothetical protein
MSGFLEKYNMDDVFLRNLIVALLNSLNDRLKYIQVNDQQDILEVYVPFYFSLTGDEPFLQDSFLEYINCKTDEIHAEGNYDIIPRGVVTFQGVDLDTGGLTNKFTRMNYTVEDKDGQMKTFSSYTNSIPLNVPFNVAMKADTLLDAFKLFQSAVTIFYKTYTFSFEYDGFRIPVQVGFPESYEITKATEFTFQSNPPFIDFNFSLALETYFPEKDLSTERFKGNLMQSGIRMNLKTGGTSADDGRELL